MYDGTQLVFVHLGTDEQAVRFFSRYRLIDAPRVSDPLGSLYRAFGLGHGSVSQLMGPAVIARGFWSFLTHGLGRPLGDVQQMPGVFLVYRGRVLRAYRHRNIGDVPDYLDLARCPTPDCKEPAE